jgi:membrane protease YdiL (CAAX protease family)
VTAGRRNQWRERAASAQRRVRLSPLPGQLAAARPEPAAIRARRRRVITVTGLTGAGLLAASLSARAGSRQFYLLTTGLACTWAGGALAAGPLPWARTPDHGNVPHRLVAVPVLTGAGAFGLFYGAARLARHIPALNQAITTVLRYAEDGSPSLVLLTASANAVAEELFFRGALWSLTEQAQAHPLATTTLAYTATTVVTRNPALTIAGTATSVLFGLHRRASGGVLAPALTHLTWSLLMLHCLPPLFETSPAAQDRSQASTLNNERGPS